LNEVAETFLGQSSIFWTGVAAISACVSTVLVVVTMWFLVYQIKLAAKTLALETVRNLQRSVDEFRDDRRLLFTDCPIELGFGQDQFPEKPPKRRSQTKIYECLPAEMTADQTLALASISGDQKDRAVRVIDRLNDIGQLLEDGFIDRRIVFGKYHVMIIQCCHVVEAVRQAEESRRGGNYGQRILRLRHRATIYNDIWPKHRAKPIKVSRESSSRISGSLSKAERIVYQSPDPTLSLRFRWFIRRIFEWY
jgi:hypothetical protein